MITLEQAKVIRAVLQKFEENDLKTPNWCDLDENMSMLIWLSDAEVVTEAMVLRDTHLNHNARCFTDHPRNECIVPVILDVVSYIIEDFKESQRLAFKARFVLEYYLSLSKTGAILHD